MSLGLTRGEIILVAFIFALVYLSGLLPKIAARIAGPERADATGDEPARPKGE